ncbi:hypothetical protein J6590_045420 [Homalodisca vitripennis]|nr:hypothetical protein J6590_045420 [Homalodisca vitripennis]
MSHQEESQSTPALIHVPESLDEAMGTSLGMIPENNLLESCTRLSISLEENGLFKGWNGSPAISPPLVCAQHFADFQPLPPLTPVNQKQVFMSSVSSSIGYIRPQFLQGEKFCKVVTSTVSSYN